MTKNEIEKIKVFGMREYLLKATGGNLWDAKISIERSSIDSFKNFKEQIAKAKEARIPWPPQMMTCPSEACSRS